MAPLYIGPSFLPDITPQLTLDDQIHLVQKSFNELFGDKAATVEPRFENDRYLGLIIHITDDVAKRLRQNGYTEIVGLKFSVPFRKEKWSASAYWNEDGSRNSSWGGMREDAITVQNLELGYLLKYKDEFVAKWPVPPQSNFLHPMNTTILFNFQGDERSIMVEYYLTKSYKFRMKIWMANVVWMLMEQPNPDKHDYILFMQLAIPPVVTYVERVGKPRSYRYAVPPEQVASLSTDRFWLSIDSILRPCIKEGPPSGEYLTYRLELSVKPDQAAEFDDAVKKLRDVGMISKNFESKISTASNSRANYTPLFDLQHLPYKIYFQLAALASQNQAVLHMMTPDVIKLITPRPMPDDIDTESATVEENKLHAVLKAAHIADVELITAALKRMASGFRAKDKSHLYDFAPNLKKEKRNEERKIAEQKRRKQAAHDVNYRWIHKIIVTPTAVHYVGPQYELINRVIRDNGELLDNFLRVQFCDEDHDRMTATEQDLLLRRISAFLEHGITICGRKFEFLHYSCSQQRNAGCWFYYPPNDNNKPIQWVREWMGDFSKIRNPARLGARMAQCFSATHAVGWIEEHRQTVRILPDDRRIDPATGAHYLFFDGVGRIGKTLGARLWRGLSKFMPHMAQFGNPTAFQLRVAGAKGMLSVDESIPENEIHLRENMVKFEKEYYVLEVVRTAFYSPAYLNRQLILLLLTLGIPGKTIWNLMEEQVARLDSIFSSKQEAKYVLKATGDGWGMTNELLLLIDAGFWDQKDPYLMNLLRLYRASQMREIKKRTRIHVPKGVHLLGVMDETGLLPEGEIIVRYSEPRTQSRRTHKGWGIITRAPCLHPGDVQRVYATDVFDETPNLKHHRDVIVFSKNGTRPLPNMLAGGDLDGDSFVFIWDERLLPQRSVKPGDYTPEKERIFNQISFQDVKAHFVDFISKNSLGRVDNAHMAWADRERDGALSTRCLRLAEIHSIAVDFAKSGIPAHFPDDLEPPKYPHYMEKPFSRSFRSGTVIGKIYDQVTVNLDLVTQIAPDPLLLIDGRDEYLADAWRRKISYDREIVSLMNQYNVNSELEIVSSFVLMVGDGRRKPYELQDEIMPAVNAIKKRYRASFFPELLDASGAPVFKGDLYLQPDTQIDRKVLAKASAWYEVTYSSKFRMPHVINGDSNSSGENKTGSNNRVGFPAKGTQDMNLDMLTLNNRMISFCWIVGDLLSIILKQGLHGKDVEAAQVQVEDES